ncbi:MAG: hypothetical protein LBT53_00815 [Puniceicoccales bacterium]|nr:hypothetical protein [Puniceicoccales bacterium]
MPPPASTKKLRSAAPALLPAPGWLFFWETLPLAPSEAKTPAALESLTLLSLESHAPLPADQLAHGWRLFAQPAKNAAPPSAPQKTANGETGDDSKPAKPPAPAAHLHASLLYYATARERLREAANGDYERAAFILPDFLLAPDTAPDLWHWLATPAALTAVRFASHTPLPTEIKSWPLPAGTGTLAARAATERTLREPLCHGKHAPTFVWQGATAAGVKTLLARWQDTTSNAIRTVAFPIADAWNADPRERAWLARERKTRANRRTLNHATIAGLGAWALLLVAGAVCFFLKRHADAEVVRQNERQAEVEAIQAKNDLIQRLDELQAIEESARPSFFDTLAVLNHLRPPDIYFEEVDTNTKTSPAQIQVVAAAADSQKITDYVKTLRQDKQFAAVTEPESKNVNGRTTYTFRVTVARLDVERESTAAVAEEIKSVLNEKTPAAAAAAAAKPAAPAAATPEK